MIVSSWLQDAAKALKELGVDSPGRDAQLILRHVLGYDELQLFLNASRYLEPDEILHADAFLRRRLNREPIAYLIGYKEFYGLRVTVDERVLIPRPETEAIVEWVINNYKNKKLSVVDIGTGSGAIALSIKHNLPKAKVTATDVSAEALIVAKANAKELGLNIKFIKSDLLNNLEEEFDLILANLPYLDNKQTVSNEVHNEPSVALYADDGGMALYSKLFSQLDKYKTMPVVVIEHDTLQDARVAQLASKYKFEHEKISPFTSVFKPKE